MAIYQGRPDLLKDLVVPNKYDLLSNFIKETRSQIKGYQEKQQLAGNAFVETMKTMQSVPADTEGAIPAREVARSLKYKLPKDSKFNEMYVMPIQALRQQRLEKQNTFKENMQTKRIQLQERRVKLQEKIRTSKSVDDLKSDLSGAQASVRLLQSEWKRLEFSGSEEEKLSTLSELQDAFERVKMIEDRINELRGYKPKPKGRKPLDKIF